MRPMFPVATGRLSSSNEYWTRIILVIGKEWMRNAQIDTDSNLRLQYLAGMWLNSYTGRAILNGILQRYRFPDQVFVGSEERIQMLKQALAETGHRDR